MVENGFVRAVEKASIKWKKTEIKKSNASQVLVALFEKYDVSFAHNFKIKNWTKKDQNLFIKAMEIYGYKSTLKNYL
jgi:hypothetical protein